MTSSVHLLVLFSSSVFYFIVFLGAAYIWRISKLRSLWVGIGGSALLMAFRCLMLGLEMWPQNNVQTISSWVHILDLLVPVFFLLLAVFIYPAFKQFNHRLDKDEINQKALIESKEKYRALIENTDAGYVINDAEGIVLECNDIYVKLTGRSELGGVVGHNLSEWLVDTPDADYIRDEIRGHEGQQLKKYDDLKYRHPDGNIVPIELFSRGVETEEGLRIVALARDVSDREADRKKLVASEKRANLLFENSPIPISIFAADGHFLRVNKAHDKLWGVEHTEIDPDYTIFNDPQFNELIGRDKLVAIFKGEHVDVEPLTYNASVNASNDGKIKTILPIFFPLFDDKGKVENIVQMHIDYTERVAAEQQLKERESFYRALINSTNDGYALLKPDETVIDANDEYIRLSGHTKLSQIKGRISRQWVKGDMGLAELEKGLASGCPAHGIRCDYLQPDGSVIPAEVSGALVESKDGPLVVILARDISERLDAEERMRQAQKMDAIGQLTGGVAHDFNNLLGVILGNAELAQMKTEAEPYVGRYLDAILNAAERGAELTRRLLAFSRKTPLMPKVVDINATLDNVEKLLQRLIGEDIDLILVNDPLSPSCEVDPNELENVVVNLANNARDAMPNGGKLNIEARTEVCKEDNHWVLEDEMSAGDYVVISVSDSGTGIDPDLLRKVTEPFFTTKDIGKGTGLGLSMAYGFAKQSHGHLSIDSTLGEGTVVKVYLPLYQDGLVENVDAPAPIVESRGNEKILLVEDDPDLGDLACHMLESQGYRVERAENVEAGIALYRQHGDFDLLLTDMILPGGRNGRDLVDELRRLAPNLKAMYMSGYTDDAIVHDGRLDEGVVLLQKPFTTVGLTTSVRQVLDS
ncbi:hypothetical protein A9Q88_04605 [Gammaproteobacteria bacterium 50_400_T64]|nr:hypothetical protein A9Q88_04605 [Gammaproteobacteria bacterium 50_400_T64]